MIRRPRLKTKKNQIKHLSMIEKNQEYASTIKCFKLKSH